MKTEVKTLIAALTTERDSIDRAIAGLKALSPVAQADTPSIAKPAKRVAKHRNKNITEEAKRFAVDAMLSAPEGESMMRASKRVSRQTGIKALTIYTGWKTWKAKLNGGTATTTATEPAQEMAIA